MEYVVITNLAQNNTDSNEQESFSLFMKNSCPDQLQSYLERIVLSKDEENCKLFHKSIIDYINDNQNCYYLIPFSNAILRDLEIKNDDEDLGLDDYISSIKATGRELNFNPKNIFSLHYHEYEENFQVEEFDEENKSFFDLISDKFLQSNIEEFKSFTEDEYSELYNTSITVLYCTICKMCEESIRKDELADLLLSVFNDPISNKFEMGDDIWNIIKNTLISLTVELEEYEEEDSWNGYLYNWSSIAEYLLENDVFDNDYIPS